VKLYAQQKEREHREFVNSLLAWDTSTLILAMTNPSDYYNWSAEKMCAVADEVDARIPRRAP
jgi:hypothetical protein